MNDDENLIHLRKLKEDIDSFNTRYQNKKTIEKRHSSLSALSLSLEIISAVCVASAIGYFIDKKLGSLPLFLIICAILGMVAGALNIYRAIKKFEQRRK